MHDHYVIIGGGIAGTVAAEKLRMGNGLARITIIEQEPYRVYNKVLLPNVIQNTVSPESIFVRTLEWYQSNNIGIFFSESVNSINIMDKKVNTTSEVFTYSKLILAYGGSARNIPQHEAMIHTFRTYDDTIKLMGEFQKSHNCTIIGGGFISLELLLAAHRYQLTSQLIIRDNNLWNEIIHPKGSDLIIEEAKSHQTKVYLNTETKSITKEGEKYIIELTNGEHIATDFITAGIGINAKPDWLKESGLLGEQGVRVNEFLQTSNPDIYACGDCAEFLTSTGYRFVGNWQNAVASGTRAAKNILGETKPYQRLTNYQIGFHDWIIAFLGDTAVTHASRTENMEHDGNFLRLFYQNEKLIGISSIGRQIPPPALTSQIALA